MNKKIVIIISVLAVVLLTTTCLGQTADSTQWIAEAIDYLDRVHHFDDIYADVNLTNRYQVSLAIANNIQKLDLEESSRVQRFGVSRKVNLLEMITKYNNSVESNYQLPEQYITVITSLANEYRKELNVLGYEIEDLGSIQRLVLNDDRTDRSGESLTRFGSNIYVPEVSPQSHNQGATNSSLDYTRNSIVEELNRQSVLSKHFNDDENEDSQIVLNSLFPLWSSDFFIGAGLSVLESENNFESSSGYAGIIGEYPITNDAIVEGQYLLDLAQPFDPGIFQIGARVRFGNMELGGLVQTSDRADDGATTSLDFTLGGPNSLLLRAAYNANWKKISELGRTASTSIDLGIPISQGRIDLRLSQEWNQDQIPGNDGEFAQASDQTKASIGFSYALTNEATFQLDYQLIDFSDVGKAFAEFSIRF